MTPTTHQLTGRLGRMSIGLACGLAGLVSLAASDDEVDISKLPPAAVTVDFDADIQPVLRDRCIRCHGPKKPKGKFRMDSRESILKGGSSGVAVVEGDSANSPLIHYVAFLVEDMEMPPPGKGDQLTPEEVGLLRAWIDKGLPWSQTPPPPPVQFSMSPTFGWIDLDGDERQFREHHWIKENHYGGLEDFTLRNRIDEETESILSGRLLRNDYALTLEIRRRDVGFVRGGYEQYRRYYDDTGGYMPNFVPATLDLDRDLSLDLGKAWFEGGLTRPGLPEVVVGYEFQFKDGNKSTTQWMPVGPPGDVRRIGPASKGIDEELHLLRADVSHTLAGVELKDNFRYEFYDLSTDRTGVLPTDPRSGFFVNTEEGTDYHRVANTLTAEKQVRDWLLVSAGYLFTDLDGDASFRQNSFTAGGLPSFGNYWSGNDITLNQQSHTGNFNAQLGPWEQLTFFAGVQPEWSRHEGFGNIRLDEGLPPLTGIAVRPAYIQADTDTFRIDEHAGLNYTRIPYTVLFAEGRLRQEQISQFENKLGGPFDTVSDFVRDTEASNHLQDYRGGFHVSPLSTVSLGGHYRWRYKKNDYDHDRDQQPIGFPGVGYSAFINRQVFKTDEIEARLVLKPTSWLKTTLAWQLEATDYENRTDVFRFPGGALGGALDEAGNYDANIYSANLVLTPLSRLYLSSTLSYADTRINTFASNAPEIVGYEGDVYSVISSGTYVLNEKTDLTATHSFSTANYEQDNVLTGLPLGVRYDQHTLMAGLKRRLSRNMVGRLQYGFFRYKEPSSGGANDYTAHGLFGTLNIHLP